MRTRDMTITEAEAAALAGRDADVTLHMDEDAFRGFYDRTSRMLWSYLYRTTGDRHLADDLLQESYYRLLRADVALDSESHRRHYLFRIATNLARDRFRRTKTRPVHVMHDDTRPTGREESLDVTLDRRMDVQGAMARLAPRERSLLWLAYAQGVSHKEIATIVGVRAASVKTLLFRARRRFGVLLGREKGAR